MQETVEPRTLSQYALREMTDEDIPALVDFFNECDALEPMDEDISLGEFEDWYHSPSAHTLFVLAHLLNADGSEGRIVGYTSFTRNPGDSKAWGWLHVHPDYRLAGVGRALYADFERRSIESGAAAMHINPNSEANLLIEFLERRGFELDRYFWQMRLPGEQPADPPTMPEGITVRTFVHDQDEELLTHVRNETFADHYGSVPRTVEEMTHRTREPHFRADGVFFAFDGDEIAGFCLTGIDPREEERRGVSVGHIHTLGVMPAYRRRGIGRALLLVGINYLRQYVSLVELGVEGKNEKALPLYYGVGFQQHRSWANMIKPLDYGGQAVDRAR